MKLPAISTLFFLVSSQALAMYGGELDTIHNQVGSIRQVGVPDAHCTATLISPEIIMTAEHCRYGSEGEESGEYELKPGQAEFLLGSDSSRPAKIVKLKKWFHAGTYQGFEYGEPAQVKIDVLFAQLEKPVTTIGNKKLTPIPLKLGTHFQDSEATYVILGYGASDKNGMEGKRQIGQYKVTSTQGNAFLNLFGSEDNFENYLKLKHPGEEEAIQRHWSRGLVAAEYQVHAWDPRGRIGIAKPKGGWTNSCNGDSGGPLLQIQNGKANVVGVISSGFNGETDGCVQLGSMISVMGPKTQVLIKKVKIPYL